MTAPNAIGEPEVEAHPGPSPTSPAVVDSADGLARPWQKIKAGWNERGVDVSVLYLGEVLGNVAGGLDRGAVYEGLLWANLDLDFPKLGLWSGASLHVSGLYPHGDSLSAKHVGDLFTLSNIDAADSVRLFEFWFQQEFWNERLSVRLGQLAADQEFAFTDLGCLFINGTCGWPALISLNVPSPAYPVGAAGARIAWTPSPAFTLRSAVYDGDPNPYDASGQPENGHGVGWSFDEGALFLTEVEVGWNRAESGAGSPGTAKLGAWYHTGDFDHQRLDDGGLSLADPDSSGLPRSLAGNWGLYGTAEQRLWSEGREPASREQGLGAFGRAGCSPADRNLLELYLEGGLHYRGLIPGRDEDEVGVAVVHGRIGREAGELGGEMAALSAPPGPRPDYEMVVEAEYLFQLRPGFTLQPGIHWILHPGGSTAVEDALVLSLRLGLSF